MFDLDAIPLGVTLFLVGAGFFLLIYFLVRLIPRNMSNSMRSSQLVISPDLPRHDYAVLVVQSGGRISFINQEARNRFNIWNEAPNLEQIARRVRPGNVFLSLCAAEGQGHFSIDGQMMEAISYLTPNGKSNAVLLSFRPEKQSVLLPADGSPSNYAVEILTAASQSMAANLELEETLQSILASVEKLIPSDFAEITIWDPEEGHLIPYRFVGGSGLDRQIEITEERYPLGEGYSGYVAETRKPVLVDDVDTYRDIRPIIDRQKYPFHSYIGYPLIIGGELIGTLDLTSLDKDSFNSNDVDILRLLSGQAAIALHNALLYREEKRRALELSSLANLTQAVSSVRDSGELYARLAQGISPLLDVQITGFLIFDDLHRMLVAQNPFVGVPAQFVELYQVEILPESPADKIWRAQKNLIVSDAGNDPQMMDLGLDHPSRAAGIKHTVLVPLKIGGRSLGYLQAANKNDHTSFTQDDVRLLSIVAGQAAPIIENADLVQQSIRRALRAEALRRIASLSGSEAALDEILKYSLIELARLLKADSAAVFFLDESVGELQVHRESVYGVPEELFDQLGRIPIEQRYAKYIVTNSQEPFISDNIIEQRQVLPIYRILTDALGVLSVVDVPMVFRGRGLGEIMLASNRVEHFNRSDIQLILTVAGQLAVAVERASLASQTDEDLRNRVDQLTALTRVGWELHSSLNLKRLLKRVYEEALKTTRADCGTILLFEMDEQGEGNPKIKLHIGDDPGKDLHALERIVFEKNTPILIEDFSNPPSNLDESTLIPAHDKINSALLVPIAYQGDVVGVFHLHSEQTHRFNEGSSQIAQALAVQAAVAIGNVRRYQEQIKDNRALSKRVKALSGIMEATEDAYSDQPLEKTLQDVASGIRGATEFEEVLVSIIDLNGSVKWVATAGVSPDKLTALRNLPLLWEDVETELNSEHLLANSYFIPAEEISSLSEWLKVISSQTKDEDAHSAIILLPIYKSAVEALGLIAVSSLPRDEFPDRIALEILAGFAHQASLVIDHQKLVDQLEFQSKNIDFQLDLSGDSAVSLLSQAPHLHAEQRVNAVLEVIESLARQPDRLMVLETLAKGLIALLDLDSALVVERGEGGPQLLHAIGDIPRKANLDALLGQSNPLLSSLNEGQIHLVAQVDEDPKWSSSPLLETLGVKGFLALPILAQAGAPSAIILNSSANLAEFSPDDERLFSLLAAQTATTLNNLTLLTETGQRLREGYLLLEFSRQLGGLESERVIRLLTETALEVAQFAQACMAITYHPESGVLQPEVAVGYSSNSSMLNLAFEIENNVVGQVFSEGKTIRLDEVDFHKHYNLDPDGLLIYREATEGALPVSSLVVPIHSGQTVSGVLVLDNFQDLGAFSIDDQALVSSLSRQVALTLENIRLYKAAEQRADQLRALSTVTADISTNLELSTLVSSLLETLENLIPYDTATLWFREGEQLTIRSVRGFENSEDLLGLKTTVHDSRLFAEMISTKQPLSISDIRQDNRFPELPAERLSWMAVPMITKGEVVGVIALEKIEIGFYDDEHGQILTTFANQAAVAMENAELYRQTVDRSKELDQRSHRLTQINRFSNEISSTLDVGRLLELTSNEISKALSGHQVSSLLHIDDELSLLYEHPSHGQDLPEHFPNAPIIERLKLSLGVFSTANVFEENELKPLRDFFKQRNTMALLILPLVTGVDVHGFIFAQSDQPYRFSADDIELAKILSNQASVALQNASLFTQTRQLTEELEARVDERTQQLEQEHQRAQALLLIMRELSASLDLDHVLDRTLKLLNEISQAEQSTILLLKPGEETFYYRASLGYTEPPPIGGRSTELSTSDGLAGWIVSQREGAMIEDLIADERWIQEGDRKSHHRSAMGVPLMVGAELLGVMLLFHRQAARFTSDQMEMVHAAANQIAVSINNAELFNLIREQAERLGNMLRTQQVETSRSRSILEAVADGVLVTDSESRITLFNESAQQILGLDRGEVVGKSLEDFSGLFSGAAQTWLDTIEQWSTTPVVYSDVGTFAERIILDDGRYVAIHLAPVLMQEEFLGTVTIFRDITHQVEVDRLKSEFVATVSHELRTPMTSIKGYVEVLLMGAAGALSEQQAQFLDVVQTNTERLNILVNDLLDVSRIDAGKYELAMQPLRLQDLTDAVVADQLDQANTAQKPISIESNIPTNLPRVRGDRDRVRQIISNLVRNAYHYTPANGKVKIQAFQVNEEIQMDVTDDGIGITAEEQERVFERFYRGEDPLVLATAGTGLGLAIVQQLIELHGGRIWLKSEGIPGKGSTFSFTLPIFKDE